MSPNKLLPCLIVIALSIPALAQGTAPPPTAIFPTTIPPTPPSASDPALADQADDLHRRTWLLNTLTDYANALATYCKNPYADPATCAQATPPPPTAAPVATPPHPMPVPPLPVVCDISGFRPGYHATVQFPDGHTLEIKAHDTLLPGYSVVQITPATVLVSHDQTTTSLRSASCGDQVTSRPFPLLSFPQVAQ